MNATQSKEPKHPRWGRKLLFDSVLAAVVALASSVMAGQPNLPGDWPTYGNGPAHTGYFPGTLNGCPFALKWKVPISSAYIWQAAVAGGRVYFSVGYYYSATTLRALDANTGLGLWTNNLAALASVSPPTYDSGMVLLEQGNSAAVGNLSYLTSYDATTGNTNWASTFISQGYRYMAPVVGGGMIFTDTGYYHGLTGFDQNSGGQQWFVQLGGSEQWAPACYNGNVYTWLGSFTEWDPPTGNANWTVTNGLSGAASTRTVAIADNRAYFIGDQLYCVDLGTKTNAWAVSGGFSGTPAVANGIVYAISGKVVNAYTTNGVFVRTYNTPTYYEALTGQLIVTDDVLIVDGAYGVYVYNLADGRILQLISSLGPGYIYYGSTISLANNTLYIASTDGNFYAYAATPTSAITVKNVARLADGSFQFSFTNTPGASFSALASTNVSSPSSNWTALGTMTEVSPGQYQFTDPQAATNAQRYYRVSAP
ncbi:MAG TPA: PQQ-binding-like beta-propeller repeat protein [Candidatus Acidoferrum sp.]|jgi:hypothetical protein|nr:PQQ-binding-like beta-propeller repeat protein [Candidatus Acidoferrum sp.]